jgi:anaerobic ribonucleoside-triphosphate reductase activating protein
MDTIKLIRISHFTADSYVDGPGCRAVLFMQGCTLACPGCQNKHLWPAQGGRLVSVTEVAGDLAQAAGPGGNVTISGGEPFQQPQALAYLLRELKLRGIGHILVYSGYTWDQLTDRTGPNYWWNRTALDFIDVLVDGPFRSDLDHNLINWAGSANQRPIDVAATREAGSVITLGWSAGPRIIVTTDGRILAPIGLSQTLAPAGTVEPTRRCGQTK